MAIWSVDSNYNLGLFEEEVTLEELPLPLEEGTDLQTITFQKISGELPPGVRLENSSLVGTPLQVLRTTDFKFCIRATTENILEDKTFIMTVAGPDAPEWQTREGRLPVGSNNLTFILDNSIIDFQLTAIDDDLPAGDSLEYYIKPGNGVLPPGTTLTKDGRIVGVIDPIKALDVTQQSKGVFDGLGFDQQPYDFGVLNVTGFDSFFYDTRAYDDLTSPQVPKKLNRTYEFIVTASDGETETDRVFSIFVVGDDFLKADNTLMTVDTGVFTSDVTSFRNVVWLTPSDLGVRRANNYVTLFLETFDPSDVQGTISYTLKSTNPGKYKFLSSGGIVDGFYDISGELPIDPATGLRATSSSQFEVVEPETKSIIPPGMQLDGLTGEIAGRVPYQPDVSKQYKFTVTADRYAGVVNLQNVKLDVIEDVAMSNRPNYGDNYIKIKKIDLDVAASLPGTVWDFGNGNILTIASVLTSTDFDTLRITEKILSGPDTVDADKDGRPDLLGYDALGNPEYRENLPAIRGGTSYTKIIPVGTSIEATGVTKTFTVRVLGEFDTELTWVTDPDLGSIRSNAISNLNIIANTTVPNANVTYTLTKGSLPNGLMLNNTGEIIGKPAQYATVDDHDEIHGGNPILTKGLIFFDSNGTTFDSGTTSFDRIYKFTVAARDYFGYNIIEREFTLRVDDLTQEVFSNIYFKPLLKRSQRAYVNDFLSDASIFNPRYMYRLDDPNFGVAQDLKMLVYAGIETTLLEKYVAATATNHRKKRYKLGDFNIAEAKDLNGDVKYEAIYFDVIDPQEPLQGITKDQFIIKSNKPITADMVKIEANDDNSDLGEGTARLTIDGRNFDPTYFIDDVVLSIFKRIGTILVPIDNFSIDIRESEKDVVIDLDFSDAEPFRPRPEGDTITADSNFITINDPTSQPRYISNLQHMRNRLEAVGLSERSFLPLWMRTAQGENLQELGYIKAIPICYCKPGTAKIVLKSIQDSNFDIKLIDFEIDRYLIDGVEGNGQEQYIKFPDYFVNV
jgi:hypothetical protein